MITTGPLTGSHVRLDPLAAGHVEALTAAANADRATYDLTKVPASIEDMQEYVARALADHAAGTAVPYAVTLADSGEVVGSTRFLDIECWPEFDSTRPAVAEIGYTWLSRKAQRTRVNTEMKFLMLECAFEQWRAARITFKTDARNARSRAAIERIGATYEGIRRRHMVASDGEAIRDSAYFSITDDEWPAVRQALELKLAGPSG